MATQFDPPWPWLAAGLVALGVLLVSWKRDSILKSQGVTLENRLQEMRVATQVKIQAYLDSLLENLANMAATTDAHERKEQVSQLLVMACESGAALVRASDARCAWFTFDSNNNLTAKMCNTNAQRPKTVFRAGTPAHREIMRLINTGKPQFYTNLQEKRPPGCDLKKERRYKTFIGVPAIAGDKCWGWLTVDSPEPGSLDEIDAELMQSFARILATAETLVADAGPSLTADREGSAGGEK